MYVLVHSSTVCFPTVFIALIHFCKHISLSLQMWNLPSSALWLVGTLDCFGVFQIVSRVKKLKIVFSRKYSLQLMDSRSAQKIDKNKNTA